MTPEPASNLTTRLLEQQQQEQEALALLLDRHLSHQLLVQKTQMGSTEAFIGSVTLEWLESRVRFASQLPLFRQKYDLNTDNVIRDEHTVEDILQRPLDWSRQLPLTLYLVARKTHKFPALLVVVSPPWVDDPKAPEWDETGRAKVPAATFFSLDKDSSIGLLDVSEIVAIFALDGQHRLMGIQGLMQLIKTGKLQPFNKQKKPLVKPLPAMTYANNINSNSPIYNNLLKKKLALNLSLPWCRGKPERKHGVEFALFLFMSI